MLFSTAFSYRFLSPLRRNRCRFVAAVQLLAALPRGTGFTVGLNSRAQFRAGATKPSASAPLGSASSGRSGSGTYHEAWWGELAPRERRYRFAEERGLERRPLLSEFCRGAPNPFGQRSRHGESGENFRDSDSCSSGCIRECRGAMPVAMAGTASAGARGGPGSWLLGLGGSSVLGAEGATAQVHTGARQAVW